MSFLLPACTLHLLFHRPSQLRPNHTPFRTLASTRRAQSTTTHYVIYGQIVIHNRAVIGVGGHRKKQYFFHYYCTKLFADVKRHDRCACMSVTSTHQQQHTIETKFLFFCFFLIFKWTVGLWMLRSCSLKEKKFEIWKINFPDFVKVQKFILWVSALPEKCAESSELKAKWTRDHQRINGCHKVKEKKIIFFWCNLIKICEKNSCSEYGGLPSAS